MNWRDHITVDPDICHGKACISGTRVLVTTVLDNLASGLDADDIARSYPSVSREAVRAALHYCRGIGQRTGHRVPAIEELAYGSSWTRVRPVDLAVMFRAAGHDAVTALDQSLTGARDSDLASVCRREGQAIITLDIRFCGHPNISAGRLSRTYCVSSQHSVP